MTARGGTHPPKKVYDIPSPGDPPTSKSVRRRHRNLPTSTLGKEPKVEPDKIYAWAIEQNWVDRGGGKCFLVYLFGSTSSVKAFRIGFVSANDASVPLSSIVSVLLLAVKS